MPSASAHPFATWSYLAALVLLFAVGQSGAQVGAQPVKTQMPRAERHETKHEIDQLEENWRTALLRRDATALGALLSDDYIGISPNGTLQSKDETLENLRSGAMHVTELTLSDRKVRFYGQTALVTSRAEITANTPNGELNGSYRYTRVYAKDSHGAWKIVSFEASRIRHSEDQ
jgi:ketosteroid isomerase-like protein